MEIQEIEYRDLRKNEMLLTNIFEEVVDPAFHSGSRGLATKGFSITP